MRIADDEWFVICRNPEAVERDADIRARMITQLKGLIDGTDALGKTSVPNCAASSPPSRA